MSTISIQLTENQIKQLQKQYASYLSDKKIAHVLFQIRLTDCVITVYQSGSTVFQGEQAEFYAADFKKKESNLPMAGSDEVGTGDYFGPVVVCAVHLTEKDMPCLNQFKIADSKQTSDEMIRQIAPELMKQLTYSLLILDNEKYNQIQPSNNMNMIKAKLHNQAYVNLKKKLSVLPQLCVVDQFTPPALYYRYLIGEPVIIPNLHFETKAENKYLPVACASIIARYAFLVKMDEMSTRYGRVFPKGASHIVDEFAQQFVDRYGFKELEKVAKLHFKNTQNIKNYDKS